MINIDHRELKGGKDLFGLYLQVIAYHSQLGRICSWTSSILGVEQADAFQWEAWLPRGSTRPTPHPWLFRGSSFPGHDASAWGRTLFLQTREKEWPRENLRPEAVQRESLVTRKGAICMFVYDFWILQDRSLKDSFVWVGACGHDFVLRIWTLGHVGEHRLFWRLLIKYQALHVCASRLSLAA